MASSKMNLHTENREAPSKGSLGWLLHPVRIDRFLRNHWERRPLVVNRHQPDYFSELLSFDEVDRVITTTDLRYPNLTLKNADRSIGADDYTVSGDSLDVAKVYQLFNEGSTITLAYLDTVIPQLTSLCRSLEVEFSFPFQANVYLTPAGAKGAKHHYDTHDVFVLQIAGSKHWSCYGTPVEIPLRDQDFDPSAHERGDLSIEFELEPGDLAYIPRGVVHDARSGEAHSLHITLGVLTTTWSDFLRACIADLSFKDPSLRKSLPVGFARQGFDRTEANGNFRDLMERIAESAAFDGILDHFVSQFLSCCPPILRGQFEQLANLDGVTLDSVVGRRPGVLLLLKRTESSAEIERYGRTITFPLYALPALEFSLHHSDFVVRDLPNSLDAAGKLTLVKRLIREGLLMQAIGQRL